MIFMSSMSSPFAALPVNARIIVIDIEPALSRGALKSLGFDEFGELRIGYRQAIDKKFRQSDFVLRPFVGWAVIAAHQKGARGNAQHAAGIHGGMRNRDKRQKEHAACDKHAVSRNAMHAVTYRF